MIQIRPIEPHEWNFAKRLVYRVAHEVFQDTRPLEEAISEYEARGELSDMDDIQKNYFESGGVFFAMLYNDKIIGTGAIRRYTNDTCELKRLWLLPEHHGKGLGYRMIQELLAFARNADYRRIRLETHAIYQKRAVEFYKRLGFSETPAPNASDDEDILMEMDL
ncbi:MAG TPA: GNAT family N-acetyltransferase [Anaerolineales bacterium]|nr:GNAT family N-acetyltransferase [Anaerolineales bacterium]HMR99040.1 GNAT family N-acetyltransferase [Anaerolineales bacterium]HNQ93194.1 GNAT family N-acetyltransferase [Anaerolineales bacterium]HNS60365.1 GNAT family N-acetyltransferase [Anaerolineales bacterium]